MPLARVTIVAGQHGEWIVEKMSAIRGDPLPAVAALSRIEADGLVFRPDAVWALHGVRSHERYTERAERDRLTALQEGLGRPASRLAALIPIRKSEAWWALAQDERRAIFEERSRHIGIGAAHLPAIARRLYHCRDLGGPFDFLTWFEYAARDAPAFDDLVARLRATEEWRYVDREIDVRLRLG